MGKIAAGSLRNKLLILLPAALVLSYFLPGTIMPLLMLGGTYLCYEGVEKVFEAVAPSHAQVHEARLGTVALNPQMLEDEKVAGAIKTDFILSAEIMAITLAAVPEGSMFMQALILALVGIGITVAVYGVVALIVKADDVGIALAQNEQGSAIGRSEPSARTRPRSGYARRPDASERRRHSGHDLGSRRDVSAWSGNIRPPVAQSGHPRGLQKQQPVRCRRLPEQSNGQLRQPVPGSLDC